MGRSEGLPTNEALTLPTADAESNFMAHLGLTNVEAALRLAQYGPNEFARARATPHWRLFAAQFRSPVIWLLLGACVVSGILRELADAIAIGAIVVTNAVVGFFQEYRAERAVLALRSMTAPRARLLRDGRSAIVPAAEVVPGDCLLLEAGDIVAADARLVEANRLSTNEAPLTGESAAVEKSTVAVAPETTLAERRDAVFMGTAVANGTGAAEVFATGMRTEIGKIAHLLTTAEEGPTPLQKRLASVSQLLLYICLGVVAIVAVAGILHGLALFDVFLSAVSLAVAAVPEGLPAVVTIALAIGVRRMASRHVLVRRLHSVETLGCATVICTDKTGTLTTGVMAVRELWGADQEKLIDAAAACSDADLAEDQQNGIGDPTEVAILVAAAKRGVRRADIERDRSRVEVIPFDTDRKRMSILRSDGNLYVKGAFEVVVGFCTSGIDGAAQANTEMASRGLRVLGVAVGQGAGEKNLHLLGLVGIADPPRIEVIAAILAAHEAGIQTVMITGDHPATALAIARELGIVKPGAAAEQLVHARATPEDKLKIVRAWKSRGAVVAMTGDGVNDAPALREADVGIAMGKTGTEVTREASDMVLADDNFASIVAAVREGRGIFDNIRKTLVYLLAGNAGELGVMLAASIASLPLPLLPLHLLWINLVTDGLPALALATDPTDEDVLKQAPRRPDERMLGRPEWTNIIVTGLLQAAITLGVFVWALQTRDLAEARTVAFSVLVFGELFRAFAARSDTRLFWEVGAFTNLRLLGVVVLSAVVQLSIIYVPVARDLFRMAPLPLPDVGLVLVLSLVPVSMLELFKLVRRHRLTSTGVGALSR